MSEITQAVDSVKSSRRSANLFDLWFSAWMAQCSFDYYLFGDLLLGVFPVRRYCVFPVRRFCDQWALEIYYV
jgi:hypothetical protein